MRKIYGEVIDNAFKAGISEAWSFWSMTPKEVQGRLIAHTKQEEQRMSRLDNLDALAWMIGVYSARAYHDPKHYPKKANLVETKQSAQSAQRDMDEESMKTILTGYAEIHNTIEGARK